MNCELCDKRQSETHFYLAEDQPIEICDFCNRVLTESSLRSFYGGRIYEFFNQLQAFREKKEKIVKIKRKNPFRQKKVQKLCS